MTAALANEVGGATAPIPAISFRGITKNFGGVQALKGIDVDVLPGTVHAFVGENGAGKSTALGIVAGRIHATAGTFTLFGEKRDRWDPRLATQAGVASIYQELTIVPSLSPHANVYLGHAITRRGFLAERRMKQEYVELCQRWGVSVATASTAGELSVAEQQLLEIMRAITRGPRVILFDEPTASLAQSEREVLHGLVRSLRMQGITVILVSHNLEEILQLSDQITVFRDGDVVSSAPTANWSRPTLVASMLGHASDVPGDSALSALEAELSGKVAAADTDGRARRYEGESVLRVEGFTLPGAIANVDLDVRAGEVVGIAGLVGSGRTSLLRSIAGAERGVQGRMWISGEEVRPPRTPRAARRLGIAMIPEDRKRQGLVMNRSSGENIALSNLRRVSKWRYFVRTSSLQAQVVPAARAVAFDPARLTSPASTLSGGNQQKLLFARWQYECPRVLLVDEPTRGVDVGAKAEIMRSLREAARDDGLAVVVVSSELAEVIAISDRVIVLANGHKVCDVSPSVDHVSADDLLHLAFANPQE